jgi:hypothetical protein
MVYRWNGPYPRAHRPCLVCHTEVVYPFAVCGGSAKRITARRYVRAPRSHPFHFKFSVGCLFVVIAAFALHLHVFFRQNTLILALLEFISGGYAYFFDLLSKRQNQLQISSRSYNNYNFVDIVAITGHHLGRACDHTTAQCAQNEGMQAQGGRLTFHGRGREYSMSNPWHLYKRPLT